MIKKFFAFFFVGIFAFSACQKKIGQINFDSSDALGISPESRWALIISPYVALRENPSFESATKTHMRRGEVLLISGNKSAKFDDKTFKWLELSYSEKNVAGWILESDVEIYPNKLRAEFVAKKISAM